MTPRVKSACRDFQSTLSMRRATDSLDCVPEDLPISIHALHEESDTITRGAREETVAVFQSTLSMRRATSKSSNVLLMRSFQSTLSMRRATRPGRQQIPKVSQFQSTLSMRRAT